MKRFLALAALVLGLAACQTEPEGLDVIVGGEVDTIVSVSLPEATRASSAVGFDLTTLDDEDSKYKLRYILEIYRVENGITDYNTCQRHTTFATNDNSVSFPVRLAPGRDYTFVAWADLADINTTDSNEVDRCYNTQNGLGNITIADNTWNAMDESRDAFTAKETRTGFSAQAVDLHLKRPFAKLRVVATDLADVVALGLTPATATITYSQKMPCMYNALEQEVTDVEETNRTHNITYDVENHVYDDATGEFTLFADYFFADAYYAVAKFSLDVYAANDTTPIKHTDFNTDIHVAANKLTTIKGDVLTTGANIKIDVNGGMDTPSYEYDIWDGQSETEPEVITDESGTPVAVIDSGSDLAWFAGYVNGTNDFTQAALASTRANTEINFVLGADIDLGGNAWTPIGIGKNLSAGETFRGTFDGNGHTIKGLYVRQQEVAGLFGYVYGATIKNVTIEGANIYSNHYAGGVVAWVLNTKGNIQTPFVLENCHVKNSTITSTPEQVNGKWDNGDKVGGLIGYATFTTEDYPVANEGAKIANCSVENTSIKAYRDFAGLVGYAQGVAFEQCSVKNVTLEQDLTHDYKAPDTPTTFGMIIGRNAGDNTFNGEDYSYEAVANGVYKVNGNYYIYNAEGLEWLAGEINAIPPYEASEYDNAIFKLANDIDLNGAEWTPIGDWASQRTEFHGTFDGQGYTISNFVITKPCERGEKQADSAYGLFGNVKGGTVKNVTVSNVTVSGVAKFAAALVGRLDGNIENCHVKNASITCSSWQVGGLVAQYNNGTISGCSVEDTIVSSGVGGVGAIVGYALTNVERTIENCSVKNCKLIQTKPYSAGYDDMFATILGGVNTSGTTININGCTAENNTIKGIKSDNIVGYIEPGAKVYVDGNLYACAETTEQLEAALKAGGHVALVNNITMTKALAISNANFVLDGNGYTITMAEDATNTYALFDITGGKAAIKNVTFDGIREGAVVRTVGVEFTAENVTAKNGQHTQVQGLFRLMGKSTIKNCSFKNNTCSMVITLNYDGANNDPQVVENCVFEGNTCNGTAVLYYVKGAGATINGNKFIDNTVNCNGNGATVYMGFTENNVVTNNLFQNNTVNEAAESSRVAGGIFFGYETVFTGNAFVGNTATGTNVKGNDVCVSTYYTSIDLSGNYWGGQEPVEDVNYFVQHKSDERVVIINDYLTVNPFN